MKIAVLSGPHVGKTREVPMEFNPMDLLGEFAKQDWHWEIDWSSARDDQEAYDWARADFVNRIARALSHGRPVQSMGFKWQCALPLDQDEFRRVMGEVDDAVGDSGYHVFIQRDDDTGVTIGTGPPEHPVQ
jgi:hypothetical protein